MNIVEVIPKGRENAVTQRELSERLGLPERTVRKLIEIARQNGEIIINQQDGNGYYISDCLDDMAKQYRQNYNRAMSILVQQKHLRRRLREAGVALPDRKGASCASEI